MKMQELTMVTGEQVNGEDETRTETTSPVMVDLEAIRNFYPRKPSAMGELRSGTRITFKDGAGMAVANSYEEVKQFVATH